MRPSETSQKCPLGAQLTSALHRKMACPAGGSRNKGNSVLTRLHALHEAQQELAEHEAALQQAQSSLKGMTAAAASYKRCVVSLPREA